MAKVSICIPTYREARLFSTLLSSIQDQNFDNFEIIVSDDSPDNEIFKVVTASPLVDKIHYYHNPVPLGSPQNWNKAVDYACSEYIKIMHHDDSFSSTDALELFVKMLDENPQSGLAFCDSVNCDPTGKIVSIHQPKEAQLYQLQCEPEILYLGNFVGAPSATIFRSNVEGRFDIRMKWLVDVDYYINVLKVTSPIIYTPKKLVKITAGAQHQITQDCKYNFKVDVVEHLILLDKIIENGADTRIYIAKWQKLFERYWITDISKILSLYSCKQETINLIRVAMRRSRWCVIYRFPFYLYHFMRRQLIIRTTMKR